MACKQRLRPRGCCDGGGSQQQWEKTKKPKNIQVQDQDVSSDYKPHKQRQSLVCYFVLDLQTKTAAPCVVPRPPPTTTPTCKQRLRPRVLFQGPPAMTTSTCKQRLWPRVLFQGPPPPQQPPKLLLNGSYKQRLEPRVLFLPCTATVAPCILLPPTLLLPTSCSSSCCCIAAAATTTSASTAWLLFCLYPMACKQRLRPRGCCDGGGSQQQREKTKKTKIYKFRDRMSNQVASLTKQDKSLYVTRGSSLCLYLVVVVVVVVVVADLECLTCHFNRCFLKTVDNKGNIGKYNRL